MSVTEFVVFAVLAERAVLGRPLFSWADIDEDLQRFRGMSGVPWSVRWLHDFQARRFDAKEDARKISATLRRKLAIALGDSDLVDQIVSPMRTRQRRLYPARRLRIRRFDDVS